MEGRLPSYDELKHETEKVKQLKLSDGKAPVSLEETKRLITEFFHKQQWLVAKRDLQLQTLKSNMKVSSKQTSKDIHEAASIILACSPSLSVMAARFILEELKQREAKKILEEQTRQIEESFKKEQQSLLLQYSAIDKICYELLQLACTGIY